MLPAKKLSGVLHVITPALAVVLKSATHKQENVHGIVTKISRLTVLKTTATMQVLVLKAVKINFGANRSVRRPVLHIVKGTVIVIKDNAANVLQVFTAHFVKINALRIAKAINDVRIAQTQGGTRWKPPLELALAMKPAMSLAMSKSNQTSAAPSANAW